MNKWHEIWHYKISIQEIKIYKEGIWLNSTEINFFGRKIRTKYTRPEKWIEWKNIEGLRIKYNVALPAPDKEVHMYYIEISANDGKYNLVLDNKGAVELKNAVIKAGYSDKLKK